MSLLCSHATAVSTDIYLRCAALSHLPLHSPICGGAKACADPPGRLRRRTLLQDDSTQGTPFPIGLLPAGIVGSVVPGRCREPNPRRKAAPLPKSEPSGSLSMAAWLGVERLPPMPSFLKRGYPSRRRTVRTARGNSFLQARFPTLRPRVRSSPHTSASAKRWSQPGRRSRSSF